MRSPKHARCVLAVSLLAASAIPVLLPVAGHADTGNTYIAYPVGISGGEPSIGFDTARNAAMYGSGTNTRRLTWNDAVFPATMTSVAAKPQTSVTTLDPITFVDQVTNRTFVSQLTGVCSLMSFSDDAGATYTPGEGCGVGTALDHQTVGGGRFHAPVPANPVYGAATYYCAQNGYSGACAVSVDGGLTFGNGVPAYNSPANVDPLDPDPVFVAAGGACSALHGHIRVGADGTAYLPVKGCGGQPTTENLTNTEFWGGQPSVSVSADNGTTYRVHRVPGGQNQDESDPSVGLGRGDKFPGGRIYLGWQDGTNPSATTYGTTSSARIAMSTNDGATWSAPVDVSTALGIHNVQFPEVIAGDDDRATFAWLGTTATGDDQHDGFLGPDGKPAVWRLYISTTYDGGETWETINATPTNPVQRGCIDLQGTSNKTVTDDLICSQRNLLDFNDITIDKQGRALVAYADGCEGTCITNANNTSSGATNFVMRQSTGIPLYAAYDGTLEQPGTDVPEISQAVLLPLAALLLVTAAVVLRRQRSLHGNR